MSPITCIRCREEIPEMALLITLKPCCIYTAQLVQEGKVSICSECGHFTLPGEWPFCPHPPAKSSMIARDEIPGGVTVENYGPHPITFYSHSERRAYMKVHGLNEKEKYSPAPGTSIDPQGIPNPEGYVDDVTMQNRRELFLRGNNRHSVEEPDPTVTSGTLSPEEAWDVVSR